MNPSTCCETGCDKPVDRPRSKVRCADHYTPPRYGGHNPHTARPTGRTTKKEEPHE